MELNRLVVVGASWGGVPALLQMTAALPKELTAAVLIVLHVGSHRSVLPELLSRRAAMPVEHARNGEKIAAGVIRIAPPDHHLIVVGDELRLSRGPKENFARPAIDPLFRSAALEYGPLTVGVVLTGMLDDGTVGLQAIKDGGGVAVVQDPADATEPSMPASALQHVAVDYCLPLAEIPHLLVSLAGRPVKARRPAPRERWLREQAMLLAQGNGMEHLEAIGKPSPFACPECHGGLWELIDSAPTQYRCHTGHSFTERSLEHALTTAGDDASWNALRALQERQLFLETVARRLASAGRTQEVQRLEAIANGLNVQVSLLRAAIEGQGASDDAP